MRQRAISSVIVVLITITPVLLGRYFFAALVIFSVGLALNEFNALARLGGHRPVAWVGFLAVAAFLLAALFGRWQSWGMAIVTAAAAATLIALIFRRDHHGALTDWAVTIAGTCYIGLLGAHFLLLRELVGPLNSFVGGLDGIGRWQDPSGTDTSLGLAWYLLAQLATWLCDVGAYLVGRTWGRHKLAPAISPGKTIEGGLGGVVLAALAALGCAVAFAMPLHPLAALGVGAILGVVGQVGDLAESLLKRQVGAKDSGRLLPGHGGIFDRIDSLLVVVAVTYYLARLLA